MSGDGYVMRDADYRDSVRNLAKIPRIEYRTKLYIIPDDGLPATSQARAILATLKSREYSIATKHCNGLCKWYDYRQAEVLTRHEMLHGHGTILRSLGVMFIHVDSLGSYRRNRPNLFFNWCMLIRRWDSGVAKHTHKARMVLSIYPPTPQTTSNLFHYARRAGTH